jgi:hypothetical protein
VSVPVETGAKLALAAPAANKTAPLAAIFPTKSRRDSMKSLLPLDGCYHSATLWRNANFVSDASLWMFLPRALGQAAITITASP